jgi:hypothetical protein
MRWNAEFAGDLLNESRLADLARACDPLREPTRRASDIEI